MVITFCRSISPICFTNSGVLRRSSNCTFTFSTVQVPMRLSAGFRWQATKAMARPARKMRLFFMLLNLRQKYKKQRYISTKNL